MTELYDAEIDRVDLVKRGANGVPRFLLAKQAEGARGVMPADAVRELLAEPPAEPVSKAVGTDGQVTMTGTPDVVAAFVRGLAADHAAITKSIAAAAERAREDAEALSVAKAEYAAVIKAKYDSDALKAMGSKGHAFRNPDGSYSYPVGDLDDLDKAIRAVGRGGADHDAIRRYIIGRARDLGASGRIPDNWASDGSLKGKV